MGFRFNPFTGNLDFDSAASATSWLQPVATEAALPLGSADGDARVTLDTDYIWTFDATTSRWINIGIKAAAVGATPNANGFSLIDVNVAANRRERQLVLQPANGSNPGVLTAVAQSIGGDKTFNNNVIITGDLTVNGTTTSVNSTNLEVTDKNITVNKNGNDASAEGAGLTVDRTGTDGSLIYENALASKWKAGLAGSEIELVNVSSSQVLTNKTIDADLNTITNIEDADIKAGAAINATKISSGIVDNTEFDFLNGVTSSIQTQLNNKANTTLSNLVNTIAIPDGIHLLPDNTGQVNLGSTTKTFGRGFLSQSVSNTDYLTMQLGGSQRLGLAYSMTLPSGVSNYDGVRTFTNTDLGLMTTNLSGVNTGNIRIESGNASGGAFNSGDLILQTGSATGTRGKIGLNALLIETGVNSAVIAPLVSAQLNVGTSSKNINEVYARTYYVFNSGGSNRGSLLADVSLPSGNTGHVTLGSNIANSQNAALYTQNETTNVSGGLFLETGNVSGAFNSGGIAIRTGTSGATRGNITLSANKIIPSANFEPAAANTYNIGAGGNGFGLIYGKFFLGTTGAGVTRIAFGSDFNTALPVTFESGTSSGGNVATSILKTGDMIGGGTGTMGNVEVRSGFNSNAANNNNTGDAVVTTGVTNSVSGSTGNVLISSGTPTGTNNGTGDVRITVGTPTGTGTQGQIKFLRAGLPAVVGYVWTATNVDGSGYWAPAGGGGVTYPLLGTDGSAAAPTYSFSSDPDTGMWRSGSGTLIFTSNGGNVFAVAPNTVVATGGGISLGTSGTPWSATYSNTFMAADGTVALPSHSFISDPDTGMFSLAPNVLALAVGGVSKVAISSTDLNFAGLTTNYLAGTSVAKFWNTAGTFSALLRGNAAQTADTLFQLPINNGSANYILQTDSTGITSWVGSLNDTSGLISVDFNTRQLKSGATVKLDWSGTDVSLNTRKLTGLAAGTTAGDAVRYEQAILATGVNAFSADQSHGGFKVTNVADPVAAQDAATKNYVDTQIALAPQWHKYTVSESAFTAASSSENVQLFSLPAKGVIHAVIMKHTVSFTGGALSAFTLSVGVSGNLAKYASAFNVFQATGTNISQASNSLDIEDFTGATSIRLAAVATGDNVNNATAGSVDVYVLWGLLP